MPIKKWFFVCVPIFAFNSALAQTDNFDDGDAAGWSEFDPLGGLGAGPIASFEVVDGAYRISSSPSPSPGLAGPSRAGATRPDVVYGDSFFLSVDIPAYDATLEQAFGLSALVQPDPALGDSDGYAFTYQPIGNDIQISRIVDEQIAIAHSNVDLTGIQAGPALRLVFTGDRGMLEGKIYNLDDLSRPIAVATAFDPLYTSGTCGLLITNRQGNFSGPADATFDNYVASQDVFPKLELVNFDDREFQLRYPHWADNYSLERSTTLIESEWALIPDEQIVHSGGVRSFTGEFLTSPKEYFRLRDIRTLARPKGDACIPNPSFEELSPLLANAPGYAASPDEIPGWTLTGFTAGGLNPIGNGSAPFADNGAIPQGRRIAFLQNLTGISTTITGLVTGTRYRVWFRANIRTVVENAQGEWSLDGAEFVPVDLGNGEPVGGGNPYREVSAEFVATGPEAALAIRQTTAADATLLIDDFQIEMIDP